ncbi:NAD(P)-binding protein [Hyaloscypha variabilis]
MPYSLKGKIVLVTGGSRGLGAAVATSFAAEGSSISINYVSNKTAADELADILRREFSTNCCVIQGDAAIPADNTRIVEETVKSIGGIDIIVANAGWTRKTQPGDIYDLSYEEWSKCWAVKTMSHLHLIQAAAPIFRENIEGGVYLITFSIAVS